MKDAVHPVHHLLHDLSVEQISFHKFDPVANRVQVGKVPRAEVIENSNLIVVPDECFSDMGADKPCSAGN